MALHLNLYHEVDKQKAASRRDPLKIAAYILGGIVAIFIGMYVWELGKNAAIQGQLNELKGQFDQLDPKAKEVERNEKTMKQTVETSERFVKTIEGRIYWAPLLQEIVRAVPREVQITRMTGNVTEQAGPTITDEPTKKTQLSLDGLASGADPRRVAEDLRQALSEALGKRFKTVAASFRQLDESPDSVTLEGRTLPTATFSINITLEGAIAPTTTSTASQR